MYSCIQLHDPAIIALRQQPPSSPPSPPPAPRIPLGELEHRLQKYILTKDTMWSHGYPVEIERNSTEAIMYVNPSPRHKPRPATSRKMNYETDTVEQVCARCYKKFKMTLDGDFLQEECFHHWGRVSGKKFECCNKHVGAIGCTVSRCHVWSGTRPGINGPLKGYVRARHRRGGIYAVDAEMCYTAAGFELASIAFIAVDGRIVYQQYVKPTSPVVDYNTRFSGIRPRDLQTAKKTLRDVQNDILGFVGTDTILIGHALENDLRALKLLHNAVVDTSDLYPHAKGFPLRRSLRSLSEEMLGRPVKDRRSGGHSPVEDARTALELVLLMVYRDRETATQLGSHASTLLRQRTFVPLIFYPSYKSKIFHLMKFS